MLYESSYYGICGLRYDQSISHHGIKGMRWGIRRFQNSDGSLTNEGKKRYSTDGDSKSKKSNFNSLKNMSDDELIRRLGRLEKEKRYIDLNNEIDNSRKSTTEKILRSAGKTAATTIVTGIAIYSGKQAIKGILNKAGLDGDRTIRDMFPKKK